MNQHTARRAAVATTVAALALTPAIATGDGDHGSMQPGEGHRAPSSMKVRATVSADPMKGHNLFVRVRGFRFAPERAGARHRQGEGHAHLYIDGKKVTRLYGPAYYLGELGKGRHVVKVTLNGNDHGDYVRAGKPVAASATVRVR